MGVEREDASIEFFVKNALQDRNWNTCVRFAEFDLPQDLAFLVSYHTVLVTPQNKRQFGIRTSLKF
jgi:hypothetical protein